MLASLEVAGSLIAQETVMCNGVSRYETRGGAPSTIAGQFVGCDTYSSLRY
jgi:hypothetical protein